MRQVELKESQPLVSSSGMPSYVGRLLALMVMLFAAANERVAAAPAPFAVTLEGNIIHIASGFSFPNKIGDFQRVMTRQYDPTGREVSVGYDSHKPEIAATIYVYPSNGRLLDTEFLVRENQIVAQHQGTKLIDRGTALITPNKTPALMANYEYTDNFAGRVQPLRSRLLVARRGDWNVEYRFTYPASEGVSGASLVDFLQTTFRWPDELKKETGGSGR